MRRFANSPAARAPALLVTRNFPPLLGGMEGVNDHLLQALAIERAVLLAGPEGSSACAPNAACTREAPLRPLWRFLLSTGWSALVLALRHRPALVLAGSGLAAPMAWLAARMSGARMVVYVHGLDLVVANRTYQALWLPFIRACDLALANSRHTAGLAVAAGLEPSRIAVLNPGTDVPPLDANAGALFRTRLALGDRPVLLSVGRLTRRKGLVEFVHDALPRIVAATPTAMLVVIGEEASDALHTGAGSERARIEAAAQQAGVMENIQFSGRCTERQLHEAYQAAQLHIFPVLDLPGDVEGFGMVALESAAHGLRTVAFAVGGVPDAVEPGITGRLVASGDYSGFADAVIEFLEAPPTAGDVTACRAFATDRDWDRFGDRLRSLLEEPHAPGR